MLRCNGPAVSGCSTQCAARRADRRPRAARLELPRDSAAADVTRAVGIDHDRTCCFGSASKKTAKSGRTRRNVARQCDSGVQKVAGHDQRRSSLPKSATSLNTCALTGSAQAHQAIDRVHQVRVWLASVCSLTVTLAASNPWNDPTKHACIRGRMVHQGRRRSRSETPEGPFAEHSFALHRTQVRITLER